MDASSEVTLLLNRARLGDFDALDAVMPLVYADLRRVAAAMLARERSGHTLQPSALVNEAYIRLVDQRARGWQSRAHFFAIAARMMRRVLVDHARSRLFAKRGGGVERLPLDDALAVSDARPADIVALDEALAQLARIDERKCRVVELRFFAGLDVAETAELLGISPSTVLRDWTLAKAWLHREIAGRTAA